MRLEPGKFYKLNNKQKVFVRYIWHTIPGKHSTNGRPVCLENVDECITCFASLEGVVEDFLFVVSEWIEPRSVTGWLNVNSDGSISDLHSSRIEADVLAGALRIACVKLTFTEGEGL